MTEGGGDRDLVNSLARGLEAIRAFTRSKPRMSLSEVAAASDLPRAAARRFLLTLVREGYALTDGKLFQLRPKVLELGYAVIAFMSIVVQELEPGLCSIAVPLRDRAGRTIAALAIGAPSGRVGASRMRERFLPVLLEAAQQMTLAMPEWAFGALSGQGCRPAESFGRKAAPRAADQRERSVSAATSTPSAARNQARQRPAMPPPMTTVSLSRSGGAGHASRQSGSKRSGLARRQRSSAMSARSRQTVRAFQRSSGRRARRSAATWATRSGVQGSFWPRSAPIRA